MTRDEIIRQRLAEEQKERTAIAQKALDEEQKKMYEEEKEKLFPASQIKPEPVETPDTGTRQQETVPMPKRSDYDYYDDFVANLYPKGLSPEEQEKRERREYIRAGILHLGNAFGALGNMFAAQDGAPAMKPIEGPDPDKRVSAFRERADKVRNAYINAQIAGRKMGDEAYNTAMTNYWRGRTLEANRAYQEGRLQLQQQKAAIEKLLGEKKLEIMGYKARGEWAKAEKAQQELNYLESEYQAKIASIEALENQRNTAAARNAAQTDLAKARAEKTRSETGDKTTVKTDQYGRSTTTTVSHSGGSGSGNGGNSSRKSGVNQEALRNFSIHK